MVSVLLNQGDGTFGAPVQYSMGAYFAATHGSITTADMNGDGRPDLVIDNGVAMMVLLNQGGGAFAAPTSYAMSHGAPLSTIHAADLNGDGRIDLAVVTDSGVSVLLNVCLQ